jgi:hypothetical protein
VLRPRKDPQVATWQVDSLIGNRPGAEATVWRYLSMSKLRDLAETSELYLPRLDLQEDDAEGRWPAGVERLMFTTGGDPASLRASLEAVRGQTYASCWTLRRSICERMWTEYAAEDGAAIGVRYSDLLESLSDAAMGLAAGGVTYCDVVDASWAERFHRVNTLVLPFQKRTSFAWEQEVRLVHQLTEAECPPGIRARVDLDRLHPRFVAGPNADVGLIGELAAVLRGIVAVEDDVVG